MLNRRPLLSLPLAAWGGAQAAPAEAARPLLLINAVYPPFVNPAGHPQGEGLDIDIAREALRRAGRDLRLELVPWKRALLMLELGRADLTTTITRNTDRDRFLCWTQSYRNGAHYLFFTRLQGAPDIQSLDDLAPLRLGVVAGFFYPPAITGRPEQAVESARDVGVLAQKLLTGRIDVMVVTATRGAWELREAGLAGQLKRQPYRYVTTSPNYLAFAKARCDEPLLAATRQALARMMVDDSIARLERHYLKDLEG